MPKLMDMMNVEDSRTQVILMRATNQIGHALKDYGLYITIDTDGNYGIARLGADFPIKDERVTDRLRRVIIERARDGFPVTGIRLSDEDAHKLAAELADLQFNYVTAEAEIYAGLVAGGSHFMDLPVSVVY